MDGSTCYHLYVTFDHQTCNMLVAFALCIEIWNVWNQFEQIGQNCQAFSHIDEYNILYYILSI